MKTLYKTIALGVVLLMLAGTAAAQQSSSEALTLEQAVQTALEHNPALRAAGENSAIADAKVGMARADWLPHFDFSQSFTRGDNPVYVFGTLLTQRSFTAANFDPVFLNTPPPLNNFQTRFDARWNVFDFGRTWLRIGSARKMKTAADYQTEQERQDLMLRVVSAYYGVLVAQENLSAAQESRKTAESNEQRVTNMAQAGTIVQSDLLSAQVFTAQMKEREIRARNDLDLARMVLNREIGLGPEEQREIGGTLREPAQAGSSIEEYEKAALEGRPALRAAEMQQQAAAKSHAEAKTEFLPKLDAFGSFERDALHLSEGPSGTNWLAGLRLDVNLFSGGADHYRLKEAQARQRQAEDQLEWFRSGVKLEVRKAYLDALAAQQRTGVARKSGDQAAESLRILTARYQAGLATMTDLLRAQTAQLDARTAYLSAVHDSQVARAQLERAAGRLTRDSELIRAGGSQ